MPNIAITSNVALQEIALTDVMENGIAIQVVAGGSLGGGTLTLHRESALDLTPAPVLLDTLALGDANQYLVGQNTRLYVTLSGATSPSFTLCVEKVR